MTGGTLGSFRAQSRKHKDSQQTSSFEKCMHLGAGAQMRDSRAPGVKKGFVPAYMLDSGSTQNEKVCACEPRGSSPMKRHLSLVQR